MELFSGSIDDPDVDIIIDISKIDFIYFEVDDELADLIEFIPTNLNETVRHIGYHSFETRQVKNISLNTLRGGIQFTLHGFKRNASPTKFI